MGGKILNSFKNSLFSHIWSHCLLSISLPSSGADGLRSTELGDMSGDQYHFQKIERPGAA